VLSSLSPRHSRGQKKGTGVDPKLPTVGGDFPAAQFSGITHLRTLWKTHDLNVSARSGKEMGEKLQIQPFAPIFIIEYAFRLSIPAVQTAFLLGINDTLL